MAINKNSLNPFLERGLRRGSKIWFGLRSRKRHAHLCLERVAGFDILVAPQVFNPALFGSSAFLARYVLKNYASSLKNPAKVLDLGCGSGLLALAAARAGAKEVIALDLNPEAAWVAGVNARLNGLQERIETRQGNLFEPVSGQTFDLILNNPPYYSHKPTNMLEHAFFAGPQQETLMAMTAGLATHLAPKGTALMVVSSTVSMQAALDAATSQGLEAHIVARRRFWAEYHLIYAFRPRSSS